MNFSAMKVSSRAYASSCLHSLIEKTFRSHEYEVRAADRAAAVADSTGEDR